MKIISCFSDIVSEVTSSEEKETETEKNKKMNNLA